MRVVVTTTPTEDAHYYYYYYMSRISFTSVLQEKKRAQKTNHFFKQTESLSEVCVRCSREEAPFFLFFEASS